MSLNKIKNGLCILCATCMIWTIQGTSVYAAPHELEYFPDERLQEAIEPEGDGIVYDVRFHFLSRPVAKYPALEGQGVGEQWPSNPARNNYTFLGWYANPERTGTPYTMDTPIYQNTDLYAKWEYIGSGGYWPRPSRGVIHGIDEGSEFSMSQTISFTAEGYNMHLVAPNDQRFRWIPVQWKMGNLISGDFPQEAPFRAESSFNALGEYTLFITYKEEIFDGVDWQATGQVRNVEEASFQVKS